MKRFCQWQRLMVEDDLDVAEPQQPNAEVDFEMDHETYIKILLHLQLTVPNLCDYSQLPHPEGSRVFFNYAKEVPTIKKRGYLIGNAEPNNMIQYGSAPEIQFGTVIHILKVINKASNDELLLVKHLDFAKSGWDGERWLKEVLDRFSVVH
ncbi:hypothetical protein O181_047920 [Austropuccinia psidii MF-1]|uniref:Uncharacterized protein n=1 Tax=Austropuccinia psidii MF-1 TaxID=1389203 RepID=A0A9Q3DW83_9BASI|nr:hypothetical protein [Austropuccinia psidii MF-1]